MFNNFWVPFSKTVFVEEFDYDEDCFSIVPKRIKCYLSLEAYHDLSKKGYQI